jgi:hypothetical protein
MCKAVQSVLVSIAKYHNQELLKTAVHLEAGRKGARWGPKKQQGTNAGIDLAPLGHIYDSPGVCQQGPRARTPC